MIKYIIYSEIQIVLDETSFSGIIFLKGYATLSTDDLKFEASAGDTFFIPAGQRTLNINGNCMLLITRI